MSWLVSSLHEGLCVLFELLDQELRLLVLFRLYILSLNVKVCKVLLSKFSEDCFQDYVRSSVDSVSSRLVLLTNLLKVFILSDRYLLLALSALERYDLVVTLV